MPARATLRIGTRGSPLARWQAEWVAARLCAAHPGLGVELVEIKTHGDRDRNSPLAAIGGAGLFTKEIQRALVEGAVEVAVHSLKDLPTEGPENLTLGAIPGARRWPTPSSPRCIGRSMPCRRGRGSARGRSGVGP